MPEETSSACGAGATTIQPQFCKADQDIHGLYCESAQRWCVVARLVVQRHNLTSRLKRSLDGCTFSMLHQHCAM